MEKVDSKDLYNKYKHQKQHINRLEVKQFTVEEHLKYHPTDYVSVISNQKLKSDVYRAEYKLKEIVKKMEIASFLE